MFLVSLSFFYNPMKACCRNVLKSNVIVLCNADIGFKFLYHFLFEKTVDGSQTLLVGRRWKRGGVTFLSDQYSYVSIESAHQLISRNI